MLAPKPALRVSRASGAEEHEPDNAEDQYRKPGRDHQEGEHRGARLGLARFGGGFDDPAPLSCSHGVLDSLGGVSALRREVSKATYDPG